MNSGLFTSVASNLIPGAELTNVVRLTGGVSADVHRLDLKLDNGDRKSLVIRAHGASHSGLSTVLEYQLQKTLHRRGFPVPMPLHIDVSRSLLVDPYIVMEFIEGTSALPAAKEVTRINIMADVLIKIHSLDTLGLPTLPMRTDPLSEVFDYLPAGSEWDKLCKYLQSLTATDYTGTPILLHGDFWPENILWHNDAVAAVLDWEDAAFGDPLSDVACCRLELRYRFGQLRARQFTQAYARQQVVELERLALWQIYVAAAAQQFMGEWGLEDTVEAHMRREALASIREAGQILMMGKHI